MARTRRFVLLDGREVGASSAREFFERLRAREAVPPDDLGRYLDLLRSRGVLAFGIDLDVGTPAFDIDLRCERAMASLLNHGWIRLAGDRVRVMGTILGPAA